MGKNRADRYRRKMRTPPRFRTADDRADDRDFADDDDEYDDDE